MHRDELKCSDKELINFLYQGYQVRATEITFVDIGSFYAFTVKTDQNKQFFLKVYPKDQKLVPIQPTIESLSQTDGSENKTTIVEALYKKLKILGS